MPTRESELPDDAQIYDYFWYVHEFNANTGFFNNWSAGLLEFYILSLKTVSHMYNGSIMDHRRSSANLRTHKNSFWPTIATMLF